MAELTKEHFDQQINKLVSKTEIGEMFEGQARLISRAFQEQKDHFDKRLDVLEIRISKVEDELKLTAHLAVKWAWKSSKFTDSFPAISRMPRSLFMLS